MEDRLGSTHLRTREREVVLDVVNRGCRKLRWRCFVAPVRGEWITIYPAGHGQDIRLAEYLASKLDCDVVHIQVTDELEFRCALWRDHARVEDDRTAWGPLVREADTVRLNALLDGAEDAFRRAMELGELLGLADVELDYEWIVDERRDGSEQVLALTHLPPARAFARRPTDAVAVLRGTGPVVAVDGGFVHRTTREYRGLSVVRLPAGVAEPVLALVGGPGSLQGAQRGSWVACNESDEVVVFDVERRTTVGRFTGALAGFHPLGDRVVVIDPDNVCTIHNLRTKAAPVRIEDTIGGQWRDPGLQWHPEGRWALGHASELALYDFERRTAHALRLRSGTIDGRASLIQTLRSTVGWPLPEPADQARMDVLLAQMAALPLERSYRACSSHDGRAVWVLASSGVYAYDWAQLIAAVERGDDTLPPPRWFSAMQDAVLGAEIRDAMFLVGSGDHVVALHRDSGAIHHTVDVGAQVEDLAVSRDGAWVAVSTGRGHAYGAELASSLQIWRTDTLVPAHANAT